MSCSVQSTLFVAPYYCLLFQHVAGIMCQTCHVAHVLFSITQVVCHMMPDLPNVGWERDMESFREFFESPAFRTDGLKIYPTLVIRGTGLYELWKNGLYKNYHPERLVDLVARCVWMDCLCCSNAPGSVSVTIV